MQISSLKYMSEQKRFFFFLVMVTAMFLFIPSAHSVMPPEFYNEQAKASKIKAIAIIINIEVTSIGKHYSSKHVTFMLEYANASDTPKIFTGICKSVDTSSQEKNMLVGGNIYYYPRVKERVYVTISQDGGLITSMTGMNPALEDAFRNDYSLIIYKSGKASAQEKGALSIPTPALKSKESSIEDPIFQLDILDELGKEQELKRQSHGHEDIETVVPPKQSTEDIRGQFIMEIGNNDLQEVTRFLELGANVNKANGHTGQTPLMMVESKSMAELLIKHGANVKAKDLDGGTMLHYAVTKENATELIKYFTSLGLDPNLIGWDNEPAIFVACQYFHESKTFYSQITFLGQAPEKATSVPQSILRALIDAGADINARDDAGNTVLMNAKTWGNEKLVALLIKLGADKPVHF